jgi:hypothetical protein
MADPLDARTPFTTAAMAEILLGQELVREASEIIERLRRTDPEDPRVRSLEERLAERLARGETVQIPEPERGADRVALAFDSGALSASWELSDAGLALAKRRVRYSGHAIVRLFTAAVGPRGVRKSLADFELKHKAGRVELRGLPRPAVHVAAVGFLGRNGAFVPLARSAPAAGPA